MKKIRPLFIVFLLFASSCAQDLLNNIDIAGKITGTWICAEKSKVYGNTSFQVIITKSTNDNSKIFIENFYQLGNGKIVSASLSGHSIYIAQQEIDGNIITGSGVISSDEKQIELSYNVNDKSNSTDIVTAVLTPF